jgi:hypothetical protein
MEIKRSFKDKKEREKVGIENMKSRKLKRWSCL